MAYDDAQHSVRREYFKIQAGSNSNDEPALRSSFPINITQVTVRVTSQGTGNYGVKLLVEAEEAFSCPVASSVTVGTVIDFPCDVDVAATDGFTVTRFDLDNPDDTFNADAIVIYREHS